MVLKILGVALFSTSLALGAAEVINEEVDAQIRSHLRAALPALEINAISKSPVPGLYEVSSANDQPLLVSADGQYIIAGEIYQLDGHRITNLSEQKRETQRVALMGAVPDSERMSFTPQGEIKAKITVFTDIDCGYCRKLHKEVPRLNELGVRVDYLAFPRAGVGSASYNKIVSAWCADDPHGAMTKAKNGEVIPSKRCENPVSKHLELGRQVGVSGTPAIVLDSGKLLPGYAPAEALAKELGVF